MANWPSFSPTRYSGLGLSQCGPRVWRFVSTDWTSGGTSRESPAAIGMIYTSKAEALADLERYARSNGYSVGASPDQADRNFAADMFSDAGQALADSWRNGNRVHVLERLVILDRFAAPVLALTVRELAPDEAAQLTGMFAAFLMNTQNFSAPSVEAFKGLAELCVNA